MDAYQTCHRLMLESPKYVPHENAEYTYLLMQIGETDNELILQGQLIDPAIPEGGSPKDFLGLKQRQQVAIIGLKGVNKVLRLAHKELIQVLKARDKYDTVEEFLRQVNANEE